MAGTKGIVSNQYYKFSAANQTITFSNDYAGLDLGEIAYITNIKNGIATVIYDPFDTTKGGTLNGLTLSLAYNTTTMADNDPLQVIVGFTPLNADPLPVTIVEGPDQKDDTEILNKIADSLDFLNLALDQSEGVEINTRDKSIKKDAQGAIVPSDVVEIQGPVFKAANDTIVADTTGYNTVIFNIPAASTLNINVLTETSNDGTYWNSIPNVIIGSTGTTPAYTAAASAVSLAANISYTIICHAVGRFVRLRVNTYSSGNCRPTAILKNTVVNPTGVLLSTTNITQIGSSAVVAASTGTAGTPGGGGSTNGTFSVAGAFVPTTNPPNAANTLSTSVPYPIGIGGREQPYVGALAGIFRYLTVDGGGRYILGGDTPATETKTLSVLASGAINGLPPRGVGAVTNNMVGAQSLTVYDTQQTDGDTHTMLLKQILQELKILNQQLTEVPFLMNTGQSKMSDPQEYRDDNSTLF